MPSVKERLVRMRLQRLGMLKAFFAGVESREALPTLRKKAVASP